MGMIGFGSIAKKSGFSARRHVAQATDKFTNGCGRILSGKLDGGGLDREGDFLL